MGVLVCVQRYVVPLSVGEANVGSDIFQVRLSVLGVGGAGTNAVNTMINKELSGRPLRGSWAGLLLPLPRQIYTSW
jgi:hypothetical protein